MAEAPNPTPTSTPESTSGQTQAERERADRLNAMGLALAKKRSDAINARDMTGIEKQWIEDEEHYAGIDDANRNETANAWRTKPPGQWTVQAPSTTRSTVFPNITRPYVDAASARIADMLLPTDDRPWNLGPTPIPDLIAISEGQVPPDIQKQMREVPGVSAPELAKMEGALVLQAKKIMAEAREKADRAQARIEDWHVESQWHAEIRILIEDAARCGAGVLKGPVPVKRKVVALMDVKPGEQDAKHNVFARLVDGIKNMMGKTVAMAKALIIKEEIKPASKRIDFWNFFPDGSCGENIHNGSYTWERDYLADRQMRDLLNTPGYINDQIVECLKEGPMRAVGPTKEHPDRRLEGSGEDKRFEIWYYHGFLERDELVAAGCDCGENEHPAIPGIITMVNNRVIKGAMNPLDTGDFPYDVFVWQRKSGMPWGDGVSRQGRTPQRIVTASVRNLMDNGGLSAGPQVVLKQGLIVPADGVMSITPRKIWYAGEDADIDDVRKAMTFFEIPSRQAELTEIMQIGLKLMEDATGLPMLLQGQMGKAPDTVGGMTLLNNNASAVLRRLARTFDDRITEPHVRRYYTWLLQHGEDDEKGDFVIDARGSSALVERDMQSQQLPQLLEASNNVAFGIDPKKTMEELLKAWHLDPQRFQFDDENWKKIVANLMQKPPDTRLQVQQLKEAGATDRLTKTQAFEAQQAEIDRKVKLLTELVMERVETMKLTGAKEISFGELKAMLAEVSMKVNAQKEISAATLAVDVHKNAGNPKPAFKPAVEPAGRARPGRSFQS